jgi:hypothetical protein
VRYERWEFGLDDADELARQFRDRKRLSFHAGDPTSADPFETLEAESEPGLNDAIRALSIDAPAFGTPQEAPRSPGLYSISVLTAAALQELHLEDVERETPLLERILYLGKAEDSLRSRLSSTHFKTGKTGWSTVRRTLAALLDLESCPRPSKVHTPEQLRTMTANYGLIQGDEMKLTRWMTKNLAVRAAATSAESLRELERQVGAALRPPLDQERPPLWSPNPWRTQVAEARARLRERAREATAVR